ncbi:hypothetical protein CTP10_R51640 [Cupriavidus sp. P-10]|nr:hypothetical protein CTP10_R51640 [Cupriavidus sp. P-10]
MEIQIIIIYDAALRITSIVRNAVAAARAACNAMAFHTT